jgi:hypothetical protein
MRLRILVMVFLLGVATAAPAQVNIGINISLFPELVQVPGYPVYYAPRHEANYFFYDGLYWGARGRCLVFERLVQRPLVSGRARLCAGLSAAGPGALLPAPAGVFPRLAA